ncbi:DNA sulfur modification protein DndB [Streptomyces griseus]|uniref:DNA sulfur modification protein DndB n=1 Tax=Streptomyces griseus group TaxID=629295 RepID=UPI0005CA699F|nr:DNA sulfur modification protein DndB [Streptomyces globisporus]AWL87906.1 DNA sulfur modification protein DndB [Streptomyces globisporus]PPA41773.1 DNA sulfur modification protein DndB [Streptomyces griseus]RAN19086.1 DNA sulfur modification protein DndB [Streptomyces badius]RAN26996.1 DNA sulfur modification protein DndB [Streptomyces badius]
METEEAATATRVVGPRTSTGFDYTFPAIRGIQAGREYYVSMCPLRLIPKIFIFDEDELSPELRAQRILNKGRLPALTKYVLDNPDDYVFSALTASVDGDMDFESTGTDGTAFRTGQLRISMAARFLINDGQHRRAAIELALKENPDLGDETIAVVFFHDSGLARSQQMFADLNRHAVRPARSIGVLYDHRDSEAQIARTVVGCSAVFKGYVEMEKSNLSARSRKMFTLSALYYGTQALLQGVEVKPGEGAALAQAYWEAVDKLLPEWAAVRRLELSASEMRRDFIHSHGIALHALGRIGNSLLRDSTAVTKWKRRLAPLKKVDWSRSNNDWEGRAIVGGRVSKSHQNVTLTVNYLRNHLGLGLSPEEQRVEDAYLRGDA